MRIEVLTTWRTRQDHRELLVKRTRFWEAISNLSDVAIYPIVNYNRYHQITYTHCRSYSFSQRFLLHYGRQYDSQLGSISHENTTFKEAVPKSQEFSNLKITGECLLGFSIGRAGQQRPRRFPFHKNGNTDLVLQQDKTTKQLLQCKYGVTRVFHQCCQTWRFYAKLAILNVPWLQKNHPKIFGDF